MNNHWGRSRQLYNEPVIDNVDVTLLKALLRDPRTTFTEIAKTCGLSTTAIKNRFHNLEKSGIINGSITQINPKSLGYNCVAITKIEMDHLNNHEVLEFLKDKPFAVRLPNITSSNIIVGFSVTKNTDELAHFVSRVKNHSQVKSVSTSIWVEMTHMDCPNNLVIKTTDEQKNLDKNLTQTKSNKVKRSVNQTQNKENEKQSLSAEHCELDTIDRAIIKILVKNARISFRKIAKDLEISPNNVIKRYGKLRKSTLPFSSITVNLEKLGYIGIGFMRIKVSHGKIDEPFHKLLETPNVIVCIKILGPDDIIAMAPFRNFDELNSLKEYISNIPNVCEVRLRIEKAYTKWPVNRISELIVEKM